MAEGEGTGFKQDGSMTISKALTLLTNRRSVSHNGWKGFN